MARKPRIVLLHGTELVDGVARLCAMNLLLHGIESPESDSPIHVDDALRADPGETSDLQKQRPQEFAAMQAEYAAAPDRRTAVRPVLRETQIAMWLCLSTACRIGELLKKINRDTGMAMVSIG